MKTVTSKTMDIIMWWRKRVLFGKICLHHIITLMFPCFHKLIYCWWFRKKLGFYFSKKSKTPALNILQNTRFLFFDARNTIFNVVQGSQLHLALLRIRLRCHDCHAFIKGIYLHGFRTPPLGHSVQGGSIPANVTVDLQMSRCDSNFNAGQ